MSKTRAKKAEIRADHVVSVELLREILLEIRRLNTNVENLAGQLAQRDASGLARDHDDELEEYE